MKIDVKMAQDLSVQSLIDGHWRSAEGEELMSVVDPSDEQVIAECRSASSAQVSAAAAAAKKVLPEWRQTPALQRAEILERIGLSLRSHADELSRLVSHEVGTPISESRVLQVPTAVHSFLSAAACLNTISFDESLDSSRIERCPVGTVAAITPWNYPLYLVACKVAPALAAGCTVVIKPSEVAPLSVLALAELCRQAGLPDGVLNLVQGPGHSTGQALVQAADIDMVSFTGSDGVGALIAAEAGRCLKPVALELGGKSPAVVLEGGDLEGAVRATLAKCFQNAGQTCAAFSRLLVPARLVSEAEELAVATAAPYVPGAPLNPTTRLGPLVSAIQQSRVRDLIRGAERAGARLLCGGAEAPTGLKTGFYVSATVLSGVEPDMEIARQEVFGPVLSILAYRDEEDALAIANGTPYGLSAAVWSNDPYRAAAFARRVRAGSVSINGASTHPDAPFGGFGRSGFGRERGRAGIEEFLTTQTLHYPNGQEQESTT